MREVQPVFVLSLPRSGSTLLQRLLAAHSEIATVSEPWFLLPLVYSLREGGTYAEYGHDIASAAIKDLSKNLPGGTDDYLRELASLAKRMYGQLTPGDERYFLDKTPRYSLIADELFSMFDDAKFIVLWRNPLSVVASCMSTFVNGQWMPSVFKIDFYDCLERLVDAAASHPSRVAFVRYEDLVSDTERHVGRLLKHLDLPHEADLTSRFATVQLRGRVGDHSGVRKYQHVSQAPAGSPRAALSSPVRVAWCRRYLRWIGASRLSFMGYSSDALHRELDAVERNWAAAPRDALTALRGAVRDASEPQLMRTKLRALPEWRRISVHT